MPQQLNAKEVKDKIRDFLEMVGPSLPVPVAKHMQMSSLFASAFLSELASEGIVKISDMKVGGSPVYYTPSKVSMLENFIKYLGGKEKEACNLLKESGILEDSQQHPAIRVALRSLKDFAFPFKYNNSVYWRYFLLSELEVAEKLREPKKENIIEQPKALEEKIDVKPKTEETLPSKEIGEDKFKKLEQELLEKSKELEKAKEQMAQMIEKKEPQEPIKKLEDIKEDIKKQKKVKPLKKQPSEEFLEEIKLTLENKRIVLLSVDKHSKEEIFGRIKMHDEEYLLAAFNKKKIEDSDLLKAYKRSLIVGLPYYILSKGEPSKKTKEAIEAHKKLASIEKIETAAYSDKTSEQ